LDSSYALWRISVPQTAPVLDLAWPQLVEWHGALRWLWAPVQAEAQVQVAAQQAGGSASIFVAARADEISAKATTTAKNTAQAAISQRLKESFDPQGIFNPARMLAQQ
jgi:glycolate oxidase FAD binding subunit